MKALSLKTVAMLILMIGPCSFSACSKTASSTKPPVNAEEKTTSRHFEEDDSVTSSVMVYIKLVIDKEYGLLARWLGGKRDHIWRRIHYDVDNTWRENPLIVYHDPPFLSADVIGRADAEMITGEGTSKNISVAVELVPHADVAIRTIPKSDGIKGTITTTISTVAEYYDGRWVEMVNEKDHKVTFTFNTCDPRKHLKVITHETRTLRTFRFERYTRDGEKWEPKSAWPEEAQSGDWRVVIYGVNATLDVTCYQYAP